MSLLNLKQLITNILKENKLEDGLSQGSYPVTDRKVIRSFIANPDNTFLVSFPRTGSHWLRMLMERYFERPSLTRVFYYPDRTDYLSLHTHDLNLDVERSHVIYLYRLPVATVYSQLQYHRQPLDDREAIVYWSELYGRHLAKWLHDEAFTSHKTMLRYTQMQENLVPTFEKICLHFGVSLDAERLGGIAQEMTLAHTRQKTRHDPQAVNTSQTYRQERERFKVNHKSLVWDTLLSGRPYLEAFFK